jgi:nondiscriminating glutamyl-tRNA synthetase
MVETVQESLVKVSDIAERVKIFFDDNVAPENDEAEDILAADHVRDLLELFQAKVEEVDEVDEEFCSGIFKIIQKETGIKGKNLFMPIRIAVTGQCHGPDLTKTLLVLGKEKLISRIEHTLRNHVKGKE